jgi:hypothetical protein
VALTAAGSVLDSYIRVSTFNADSTTEHGHVTRITLPVLGMQYELI